MMRITSDEYLAAVNQNLLLLRDACLGLSTLVKVLPEGGPAQNALRRSIVLIVEGGESVASTMGIEI